MAVTAPPRGLFGLAPAPFVEGDFIAALRVGDGNWATVQPVPEPFPNAWQRRVLLWFLIAAAVVVPAGWLFSRRLVRPIAGFARAAERLGREPAAPVLALQGPAEIGRWLDGLPAAAKGASAYPEIVRAIEAIAPGDKAATAAAAARLHRWREELLNGR